MPASTIPEMIDGWSVYRLGAAPGFVRRALRGPYRIEGRWSKGRPDNWVLDVYHLTERIGRARPTFEAACQVADDHAAGKLDKKPGVPDPTRPAALREVAKRLHQYATEIARHADGPPKSGGVFRGDMVASVVDDVDRLLAPYRQEIER